MVPPDSGSNTSDRRQPSQRLRNAIDYQGACIIRILDQEISTDCSLLPNTPARYRKFVTALALQIPASLRTMLPLFSPKHKSLYGERLTNCAPRRSYLHLSLRLRERLHVRLSVGARLPLGMCSRSAQ
jgi:hypothetical protein